MKVAGREVSDELRGRVLPVRALIFDVDGVLTDGRVVLHGVDGEAKCFDVHDGHGIRMAGRDGGLVLAILTARRSVVVARAARELGVAHVFQGCLDKAAAYERFKAKTALDDKAIAFMGDDVIDLPVMRRAGLALAPATAVEEVCLAAHYVTGAAAGRGAAREAVELILKTQGKWDQVLQRYLW